MLGEDDIDAFTRFQLDVTSMQAVSGTIAGRAPIDRVRTLSDTDSALSTKAGCYLPFCCFRKQLAVIVGNNVGRPGDMG